MKSLNIWNSVRLDSFDIEIPFSISKDEIVEYFMKKEISIDRKYEQQITVKSKLLSLDIDFLISFQFVEKKLISIMCSPYIYLEDKLLICRYKKIQKALEEKLGKPHNYINYIMNILVPESSSFYWIKCGIKIEHYILNRFGMEEIIDIKIDFN